MKEAVVGIDFGSSGSGFAYAFLDDKENILIGDISGGNAYNKAPSEIILDSNGKTKTFGLGCIKYIKEKDMDNLHYFKEIKMNLYKKRTEIKAKNSGKLFELKLVIQRILEEIKKEALIQIRKHRPTFDENKIKWVVTVPAIWQEFEKNIMLKACIGAGLIKEENDKSLFFALEPEAASFYCLEEKSLEQDFFKAGNKYIVCDLGGGTGDIVVHSIEKDNNLNEIFPAFGGDYGSNKIDSLIFEEIINVIFNCKNFEDYKKKYYENNKGKEDAEDEGVLFGDWIEFERQIKNFKEGINIEKKDDFCLINCSYFQDLFKNKSDIITLVEKYNRKCEDQKFTLEIKSSNKWIIKFPYIIIYNYIKKQVDIICNLINDKISSSKSKINSIICVGGYCENKVLMEELKKSLTSLQLLQPPYPCQAIMKGSVLFGINPNKIKERIAKYTYGIEANNIWDDNIHSKIGKKIFNEDDQEWFCEGCFDIFIRKGEKLLIGQEIKRNYDMVNPRCGQLNLYKTELSSPVLVNQVGIEKIGSCELDAGQNYPLGQREFILQIKFGGTFINVTAKHIKSGKKIKAEFEFI